MKYEKPTGVRFLNHRTYKEYKATSKKLTVEQLCEQYPEQFKQENMIGLTIPGQSITIKELKERHEKGRPIPTE